MNVIDLWLDKYGDPKIDRQVDKKIKLVKQVIDEINKKHHHFTNLSIPIEILSGKTPTLKETINIIKYLKENENIIHN